MQLSVRPILSTEESTISALFVDDVDSGMFILEDPVREEPGVPVSEWKIKGRTAIPAGNYRVTITQSARFNRPLPLLNDVPGFAGIRIHSGNTSADTEGCLLPGLSYGADRVNHSRDAFNVIFSLIQTALNAGEEVWCEIIR